MTGLRGPRPHLVIYDELSDYDEYAAAAIRRAVEARIRTEDAILDLLIGWWLCAHPDLFLWILRVRRGQINSEHG